MNKESLGVLFDFNGVIIDDYQIQKSSWAQIAQELRGYDVTDEEMFSQIRGIPTIQTVRRMAEEKNLSEEDLLKYTKRKDAIVQDLFENSTLTRLTNGLIEFLDGLKAADISMTIVSSSSLENLRIIFDRFRLFQWFDIEQIVHKDSRIDGKILKNKPEPDPYLAGARIVRVKPRGCFVFEDAKSGIESAKRAGIHKIVAVNTNPSQLITLVSIPGVIKGIKDFTQIEISFITGSLKNL